MYKRPFSAVVLFGFALVGTACFPFSAHDEPLDGPYRLFAADTEEDMILCRETEGGCSGDGLPGPTIFAAGVDARYVVFARRPRGEYASLPDRQTTEYYYLVRAEDRTGNAPDRYLHGPFDAARFEQEKERLGLPEFSWVFDRLS